MSDQKRSPTKRSEDGRETVGKVSSDLLQKDMGPQTVVDMQREMQKDYLKNLVDCINNHKNVFPSDFFIVVISKNERLMPNVFRGYFLARLSCPTPEYDQTVFKYNKDAEYVEHIWTIPSQDACNYLHENAKYVVTEEQELLQYVLRFLDGSLLKLSKQLNGEEPDTPFIT